MGNSPLFSIIVPVYNVEKYLTRCLQSIVNQIFINWELLLIDDGSSDNSGKICDLFALKDKRIKIYHTTNNGVSYARNIGLNNSKGEWLTFVDSDDYVDNDWLSVVYEKIQWCNADLYTWGNYNENEFGVEFSSRYIPDNRSFSSGLEFVKTRNYRHGSVWYLYKTEWIQKYNCLFPVGIKRSEDQCFLLQYLSHNPIISTICRPFYHYVKREGSVSNSAFDIDDIKDNLAIATIFAKYAREFNLIDPEFVYHTTTKLFYDYFSYLKLINKLFDHHTQSVFRIYYKAIIDYVPNFHRDRFLKKAYYSIKYSYLFMSFKNKINSFLHPYKAIDALLKETEHNLFVRLEQKIDATKNMYQASVIKDRLQYSAIHSQESGITKDRICDHEVVVSLTTYSLRIHEVYLTIESIMQGSLKPNRFILWLAKDEFEGKQLPIAIQNQMKRGLEVNYCEDIRSYKKIIPSLSLFPEACIITLDDDLIYEIDLLEHLVSSYKQHPDCVSACRIHRMKTNTDGIPLPYKQWDLLQYNNTPSHNNFLTSGGGALFPPNSLHQNVKDKDTFLRLCPNADDIWLNAMLILNGVKVTKAFTHDLGGNDFIPNESPYVQSLWSKNQNEDGNDLQIKAVWQKYELNKNIKYK